MSASCTATTSRRQTGAVRSRPHAFTVIVEGVPALRPAEADFGVHGECGAGAPVGWGVSQCRRCGGGRWGGGRTAPGASWPLLSAREGILASIYAGDSER